MLLAQLCEQLCNPQDSASRKVRGSKSLWMFFPKLRNPKTMLARMIMGEDYETMFQLQPWEMWSSGSWCPIQEWMALVLPQGMSCSAPTIGASWWQERLTIQAHLWPCGRGGVTWRLRCYRNLRRNCTCHILLATAGSKQWFWCGSCEIKTMHVASCYPWFVYASRRCSSLALACSEACGGYFRTTMWQCVRSATDPTEAQRKLEFTWSNAAQRWAASKWKTWIIFSRTATSVSCKQTLPPYKSIGSMG